MPKYLPDERGEPGVANRLRAISLEHKLGLHGSPTAVMEYDGATGWMIGKPHGGMAAMFTMMNNARLGVGVEGLGVAEAATQKALAYALERRQGRTPDGSASIAGHADVRRMLMTMQALTRAVRAICYDCALALDMGRADDPATGADGSWRARGAFLTPIAKAFGTDTGIEVAGLGVQVHGGMGFVEETGAAQYLRDVRVTAIYEGTNGIQAMDLVGRKLADGGAAAQGLIAEVEETAARLAAAGDALASLAPAVEAAAGHLRAATDWMLAAPELNDRFAGATPYLRLWGHALGAHYLAKAALADASEPRLALARFHCHQIAPQTAALAAAATQGAAPLYAVPAERLGA